ncbi:MAG TPA: hypothetical protein VMF69_14270, partial [Gemmataceae bacterium]|nr:hypothetical protein [Gemmataceae bacterium]
RGPCSGNSAARSCAASTTPCWHAWQAPRNHTQRHPTVSRERGRQIMEAAINSIRQQIEAACPQLARQGINGWDDFKEAFKREKPAPRKSATSKGHAGREV